MTPQQAHTKADSLKSLIRRVVREEVDLPDEALIFLDLHTLLQVVTEKRVELIELIAKHNPHSIQEIANMSNRQKQAVDRDIKILEKYGVIELIPEGRNRIPRLVKRIVVFNLAGSKGNGHAPHVPVKQLEAVS